MYFGKDNSKSLHTALFLLALLSLEACSVVFPVIAPFADLPPPTGTYTVATHTNYWTDSLRDETFTAEEDFRKIVVQVWYPIKGAGLGERKLYIDEPNIRLPALAKQLGLPVALFRHFDQVKTNSYGNLPSEDLGQEFPVILFSHGLSGMRFQNTALMEELASQGYVVFAADHSYGANVTIFPDGETAQYKVGKRRITRGSQLENIDLNQLGILVGDLRFMLNKITHDSTDIFLTDLPMDITRIGAAGHSIGGAAVLNTMAVDPRIQAGMILDGWYIPIPDSVIAGGVKQAVFHLGQKEWVDHNNYVLMDQFLSNSQGPIFKLLVPETEHTDFTDMPLFTPFSLLIGYTQTRDPQWMNRVIRKNSTIFFNTYLKQTAPVLLEEQIQNEETASSYIFIPPSH